MKIKRSIPFFIVAAIFAGCKTHEEVQADFEYAKLVKVDTVYRYQRNEVLLTWRCHNNVQLVSFVKFGEPYKIGSVYRVLLTK